MLKDSNMTTYETLKFEVKNRIAYITLDRPDAANGMNMQLLNELADAAVYCDNDSSLKAVLLTASGTTFFSAGGDVHELTAHGEKTKQVVKGLADVIHKAISTFSRMKPPVIVAVNGACAGAGFSLAMCGDIVIASDTASFIMAYTKAGLCPDGGASYFLSRLVGIRRTQELMFTNKRLSAQKALEWGLISKVVPPDTLMESAQKLASNLSQGSLNSHAIVKKLLLNTFTNSMETQMELEARYIAECASSKDGKEGLLAFKEKRRPNFL
jgi:2-(1,2-epoxy-1,2-dihydrophenyl)acetyl-CoA isomerase